ncbi:MAG: GrpB family protein [Chloroflexi bacterium]|nr:GrpB family protein [Chloroflexota bacterium]
MVQKFEVVPQRLFRLEVNKIIPVFGSELVAVHQLSSIALSKPMIDIWVEVADIEKIANFDHLAEEIDSDTVIDEFTQKMIGLGYTPQGEQGLAGRRFFTKESGPVATYHVHIYQFGHFQPGLQEGSTSDGILLWLARPKQAETLTPLMKLDQAEINFFLGV